MTPEKAEEIVSFIKGLEDTIDDLGVHCRSGISRSGAVAKWVADT